MMTRVGGGTEGGEGRCEVCVCVELAGVTDFVQ